MIASIGLSALYALIIGGFGYSMARYYLRLTEPLAIAAMTFAGGTVSFLVVSNIFGYAMPIAWSFWFTLGILGLVSLAMIFLAQSRPPSPINQNSLRVLYGLCALIVVVGFMNARFHGSDPWSWQHFPLASTIVEGNFPVMSPIDPLHPLRYHYAPAFLAAAFRVITGFPLTVGFALQPFIGAAGILLFAASIAATITRSKRTILLAALFALMGSGLEWMKIGALFSDLVSHYVFHESLVSPFRNLAPLYSGTLTTSLLTFLGHRSLATGYPLFYGFLFCGAQLFSRETKSIRTLPFFVAAFIFALGLTLTMEIGFFTLWLGSIVFACAAFLLKEKILWQRAAILSAVVFPIAFLIAFFHGAVISGLGSGESSFALFFNGKVLWKPDAEVAIYHWEFIRSFGLPLLLLPFSCIYAWRARTSSPMIALVLIVAAIHFAIPFFILYLNIPGEMHRVFFGASTLFAFLLAFPVGEWWLTSPRRLLRISGYITAVAVILSAAIYGAVRITIPDMRFHASPLFLPMPSISDTRKNMYEWVREHTTTADYFYVRNLTVDFRTVSDEMAQMQDRILFTTYTGRFTIGPIIYWNYEKDWLDNVMSAEKSCSLQAMRALQVRYLLIEDEGRADWFADNCKANDWNIVYGNDAGTELPRIYEIR